MHKVACWVAKKCIITGIKEVEQSTNRPPVSDSVVQGKDEFLKYSHDL